MSFLKVHFVAPGSTSLVEETLVPSSGDADVRRLNHSQFTESAGVQSASRHVLFIASRFPPAASVGATRARKFVKYLGEFGWKPVVLTCAVPPSTKQGETHSSLNFEVLREVPGDTPIQRIAPGIFESADAPGRTICSALSYVTRPFGIGQDWLQERIGWRLDAMIERITLPDRGVWRLHRAVIQALRLHRKYRFKAIFSTGMPFSDHLVALAVRRLIARPWVADFRDPWVEYVHWGQWQTTYGRRATQMLESLVVRNATRVVSVNDHMTRRFVERYPAQASGKFVTIENGYDESDFKSLCTRATRNHFRLVYAGSLYETRSPHAVLAAFRRFLATTPNAERFARFDFLGQPGPYLEQFDNAGFAGCVRHLGRVPHGEAIRATAEADLNVVILPNLKGGKSDSTAKVYECLGSGKPILAAVPLDGAAAAILSGFDGVSLCAPDDVESITNAIKEWYGRWLKGDISVSRSAKSLMPLTRRHQAGLLGQCLNDVAAVSCKRNGGVST